MRRLLLAPVLAAVLSGVSAGTQVVLQDGQAIDAEDVRRDGDVYVVELEAGGALTIPVSLVSEIRVAERGAQPKPVPGLTYGEPEQLAGPLVDPLDPADAQAVFGEPSRFRPSVLDPNWEPTSGFPQGDVLADSRSTWRPSIIDPSWQPESGFPEGDVLAGSRSTWREPIIDNTWVPEDGFKKKETSWRPERAARVGARVTMTGARRLAPPPPGDSLTAADPEQWYGGFDPTRPGVHVRFKLPTSKKTPKASLRACAQKVLQASGQRIAVGRVDDVRYSGLPVDVYQAVASTGDDPPRAVFTMAGGTCRAISGDLRDPLGVPLTRSYARARAVEAFDSALGETGAARLRTAEDKVDYAFAVVSLVDPDVGGRQAADLALLEHPDDLRMLAAREAAECTISASKRRKAVKRALRQVVPPRVVVKDDRETVEFFTWSSAEGEVVRHSVLLAEDGKASLDRETIASHLGAHTDRDRNGHSVSRARR
jgi:hypothetical protein